MVAKQTQRTADILPVFVVFLCAGSLYLDHNDNKSAGTDRKSPRQRSLWQSTWRPRSPRAFGDQAPVRAGGSGAGTWAFGLQSARPAAGPLIPSSFQGRSLKRGGFSPRPSSPPHPLLPFSPPPPALSPASCRADRRAARSGGRDDPGAASSPGLARAAPGVCSLHGAAGRGDRLPRAASGGWGGAWDPPLPLRGRGRRNPLGFLLFFLDAASQLVRSG